MKAIVVIFLILLIVSCLPPIFVQPSPPPVTKELNRFSSYWLVEDSLWFDVNYLNNGWLIPTTNGSGSINLDLEYCGPASSLIVLNYLLDNQYALYSKSAWDDYYTNFSDYGLISAIEIWGGQDYIAAHENTDNNTGFGFPDASGTGANWMTYFLGTHMDPVSPASGFATSFSWMNANYGQLISSAAVLMNSYIKNEIDNSVPLINTTTPTLLHTLEITVGATTS
jgi:hypothetical protein